MPATHSEIAEKTDHVRSKSSVVDFCFEAAGVLGLIATLLLCMLAFAVVTGMVFWATAAVSLFGTLCYIVYQVARWAMGATSFRPRQMMMVLLVPALALLVGVLLSGQRADLFILPFGHRAVRVEHHVITLEKNKNGKIVSHETTTTSTVDPDKSH